MMEGGKAFGKLREKDRNNTGPKQSLPDVWIALGCKGSQRRHLQFAPGDRSEKWKLCRE